MALRRVIYLRQPATITPALPCEARSCGKPSTCVMVLEKSDVYGTEWHDVRSTFLCAEHEAKARKRYGIQTTGE